MQASVIERKIGHRFRNDSLLNQALTLEDVHRRSFEQQTAFFGESHSQWFGSLGASLYSLFQIMTLESWSMGIVRPVMEEHPWAWAFFVPFILIATFTMLNLFIAIIVSAMQAQTAEEHEEEMVAIEEAHADEAALIQREIGALRSEVAEVRRLLEEKNRG